MENLTRIDVQSGKPDQCWKALESDIGFSSYATYLRDHHADHTFVASLLEALNSKIHVSPLQPSDWTCSILDLSETVDSAVGLTQNNLGPSGAKVLEALQRPPNNVCLRILLWHDPFESMLAGSDLVDAFGLVLSIEPEYFDALWEQSPNVDDENVVSRPSRRNFVKVGNNIITIGSYKPQGQEKPVSFVLIAGKLGRSHWWSAKKKSCSEETYDSKEPASRRDSVLRPRDTGEQWSEPWLALRVASLRRLYAPGDRIGISTTILPFASIFPLLQQDIEKMRLKCRQINSLLTTDDAPPDISRLYSERFWLRHWIEDAETTSENLVDYVSTQCKSEWLRDPVYLRLENSGRQLRAQARRLEAEILAFLQLHSGSNALEELRKSIDLSNSQIEEGKRGKTPNPENTDPPWALAKWYQ